MENKDKKVESRRSFLKKAAYAVPTVVALGQITNPVQSVAGSFIGGGKETDGSSTTSGTDRGDAYNIFGK
jgi:hypothetical protein